MDRPPLPQVANIAGFNDSTEVRPWMFRVDPFTFGNDGQRINPQKN